jgi:uncharacterized protein (DUF427 family)
MSERADRNPQSIKIPGPDHPITIERNTHRIVIAVAGRVVADTRSPRSRTTSLSIPTVWTPSRNGRAASRLRAGHPSLRRGSQSARR